MQKCPELSRLPKAAKHLKSLNFKRMTPGSATGFTSSGLVNPRHPANRPGAVKSRVIFESAHLSIHAVPKATLRKPATTFVEPFPPSKRSTGQVNFSLQKSMSTAELPTAVIRSKIATKIKTALAMIVTRGADVRRDTEGKEQIVFDPSDAGRDWILEEWTYVVRPRLQLYRMPYQTLIPILRNALISLRSRAQQLESQWHARDPSIGGRGAANKEVAASRHTPTKSDTRRHADFTETSSSP